MCPLLFAVDNLELHFSLFKEMHYNIIFIVFCAASVDQKSSTEGNQENESDEV